MPGASGSLDFTQDSGSYSAAAVLASPGILSKRRARSRGEFNPNIQPAVVFYFQRVYDSGTGGWCYYTKRFVDPTPAASETSPAYTGAISNHSIVEILDDLT